ncbi:MAG: universal stress protein [Isosphaeraceae bacterium]|nr:universal stress protein [Isosphaeraceae bacterium]
MLRSILVGLDGTPDGEAAVELGLRWAQRFEAALVGIGVVDEPGIHGAEEFLVGQAFFNRLNRELLAEIRQRLGEAARRFLQRCGEVGVAGRSVEETGAPDAQIVLEAQRHDLILLGQRTQFRFGREDGTDDTLTRVVSASPRPVVMVPGAVPEGEAVIVAYDGSLQAARALYAFEASGLGQGQTVHIISVDPDAGVAAGLAERACAFLRCHEIEAQAHPIAHHGMAAGPILDRVRQLGAGLLVMGAYGKPTLREFFLGTVTRNVLKDSPVPVFLFH